MNVTLSKFRVSAYRSCKALQFSPNRHLTTLIGPNGSGKTNLLHAILLLRVLSRRPYYSDDSDLFSLSCKIGAEFLVGNKTIGYRASVDYRPNEKNRDEVIEADERWNFGTLLPNRRTAAKWVHVQFPSGTYRWVLRSAGKVFPPKHSIVDRIMVDDALLSRKNNRLLFNAISAIAEFRSKITYYSASQFTNPAACPTSFEIDEDGDLQSASAARAGHVRLLHDIYSMKTNQSKSYEMYLSLVGKHGLGLIDNVTWRNIKLSSNTYSVRSGGKVVKKKKDRILVVPTIHIGRSQLSFNQLSEGTFRTLSLIFYVVTDESRLLLLEEPEVCVHHGLLNGIVEIIRDYSREKQIIFSTHSESVVDRLAPENLLLVSRTPNKGTTVIPMGKALGSRRLMALKEYLSTVGNLGDYWKAGGFQ